MNDLPEQWRPRYWILGEDGRTPVGMQSLHEWGQWFQQGKRKVARHRKARTVVSTVFLGLDHGYCGGPPILFETMIFGGPKDGYQVRYSTWDEAERGHAVACVLAKVKRKPRTKGADR